MSINPDNTVTYSPAANLFGSDSFTYTIVDTWGETATGTVTVTISAVNDPPVAFDGSAAIDEDLPLQVPLVAMDVDDSDLTFAIVSGPSNGTLGPISGGSIIYTPSPNFYGSDSFTFKVSDGTAESTVAMVSIVVAPVNELPVANGDAYITDSGTSLVVPAPGVLANDTDVEGAQLSAVLVTNVANGLLTLESDGSFV